MKSKSFTIYVKTKGSLAISFIYNIWLSIFSSVILIRWLIFSSILNAKLGFLLIFSKKFFLFNTRNLTSPEAFAVAERG